MCKAITKVLVNAGLIDYRKKKIVTFMEAVMTSNEPRLKNITGGLSYYSCVGLCSRLSILLRFLYISALTLSIPAPVPYMLPLFDRCCSGSIYCSATPATICAAPVIVYAALFLYPGQFYLTVMLLRLLYVLLRLLY